MQPQPDLSLAAHAAKRVIATHPTMSLEDADVTRLDTLQKAATALLAAELLQPLAAEAARQSGSHNQQYVVFDYTTVLNYLAAHQCHEEILAVGLHNLIAAGFIEREGDARLILKPRIGWETRDGAVHILSGQLALLSLGLQ